MYAGVCSCSSSSARPPAENDCLRAADATVWRSSVYGALKIQDWTCRGRISSVDIVGLDSGTVDSEHLDNYGQILHSAS